MERQEETHTSVKYTMSDKEFLEKLGIIALYPVMASIYGNTVTVHVNE